MPSRNINTAWFPGTLAMSNIMAPILYGTLLVGPDRHSQARCQGSLVSRNPMSTAGALSCSMCPYRNGSPEAWWLHEPPDAPKVKAERQYYGFVDVGVWELLCVYCYCYCCCYWRCYCDGARWRLWTVRNAGNGVGRS
jgi:hypothetical protein